MSDQPKSATRRTILIGAATLSGLPLLAAAGSAQAAGTMRQANAKYQTMPKGAQQCSKCNYFIPGASATVPVFDIRCGPSCTERYEPTPCPVP